MPHFLGRGSIGRISSWYRALTDDTKALVHEVGFKLMHHILSKSFASAILVQALAERWWDITHAFHIPKREMIVTPRDFYQMTGLRCDCPIINVEAESSIELSIELLGWRHITEIVLF